uniref:39S ribosomal protein L1, mitochondrial n=1 Tax=Lygus hesperus TaxID=30085 RepID=A0A0A9VZT1_LYGHE
MEFWRVTSRLKSQLLSSGISPLLAPATALSYIQSRGFAARRGTRAKMAKKKVKVEVKKVGFIPHNLREKTMSKGPIGSRRLKDEFKPFPTDDVWIQKFYRWRIYDAEEAIQCFRETHHPEIYNMPSAPIRAFIELDMRGVKKNKYVDPFAKIASIPHAFDHGEDRSVLVFCKTPQLKEEAEAAGATLVGDADVLKKIERGEIVLPDFQFVVAHPNILPELVSLRGLLKKKFPNPKNGTLGPNIGELIKTVRTGIQYLALRDENELDYGFINTSFGKLDMETSHLRENLIALLESIQTARPKREGPFITRVLMTCPPSVERLKLNLIPLIGEDATAEDEDSDSDDEEPKASVKAG